MSLFLDEDKNIEIIFEQFGKNQNYHLSNQSVSVVMFESDRNTLLILRLC